MNDLNVALPLYKDVCAIGTEWNLIVPSVLSCNHGARDYIPNV